MRITEQQFHERQKQITEPHRREHQAFNERLLRQAETDSSLLTGHPAWDHYLQRLQVLLDDAVKELAGWHGKIAGAYGDADVRMVQIQVNVFQDRVQTLRHCMNLPKDIIQHAGETLDKSTE